MRVIATAIAAITPYLVWTFVTLDPVSAFSNPLTRIVWLTCTIWCVLMAFAFSA